MSGRRLYRLEIDGEVLGGCHAASSAEVVAKVASLVGRREPGSRPLLVVAIGREREYRVEVGPSGARLVGTSFPGQKI